MWKVKYTHNHVQWYEYGGDRDHSGHIFEDEQSAQAAVKWLTENYFSFAGSGNSSARVVDIGQVAGPCQCATCSFAREHAASCTCETCEMLRVKGEK